MNIGKTTIGVATAIIGFVGGAAFKNVFDAYYGYERLTLDQHKQLLEVFRFHNEIRKTDKSGIATKYVIVMGETNVLPPDVAKRIAEVLAEDTPGAEAKAAVAAATIKVSEPVTPPVASPDNSVSGRMFVQVSSEAQRALFASIRQPLSSALPNIALPPLEVRDDYKGGTELRYFLPDDQQTAKLVLTELRKSFNAVRCVRARGYEKKGVRSGLLELWIGPSAAAGTDPDSTPCGS